MNAMGKYPFRVLIVDDERRDWAEPMQLLLKRNLQTEGLEKVVVDVAFDKRSAEYLLATHYYHVSSFDMRLPEWNGEAVSVASGIGLARLISFPKRIVYSQTIRDVDIKANPREAVSVLRLPADLYAKPTNADEDAQSLAVEVLTVKEWAQRVVDCLKSDELTLTMPTRQNALPLIETMIGAYLKHGIEYLPPFLARKLQELANTWETRSSARVDAAIALIEGVVRLALVQSAVLLMHDGQEAELPGDEKLVTCITMLRRWNPALSAWNWSNYLTEQAIAAFDAVGWGCNDRDHSMGRADHQKNWMKLRVPLQYALDIAAYWVRHPLLIHLRYSRDGWSGQWLAGKEMSGKRHLLPEASDFPTEAAQYAVWQSIWRLGGHDPYSYALNWADWMMLTYESDQQWWFPCYVRQGKTAYLSLISGELRT